MQAHILQLIISFSTGGSLCYKAKDLTLSFPDGLYPSSIAKSKKRDIKMSWQTTAKETESDL